MYNRQTVSLFVNINQTQNNVIRVSEIRKEDKENSETSVNDSRYLIFLDVVNRSGKKLVNKHVMRV